MSQKALILEEIGQRLVEADRPIPQPGKGELLIKLTSVGCTSPFLCIEVQTNR
jgi:NADPH2:quinone reductase